MRSAITGMYVCCLSFSFSKWHCISAIKCSIREEKLSSVNKRIIPANFQVLSCMCDAIFFQQRESAIEEMELCNCFELKLFRYLAWLRKEWRMRFPFGIYTLQILYFKTIFPGPWIHSGNRSQHCNDEGGRKENSHVEF